MRALFIIMIALQFLSPMSCNSTTSADSRSDKNSGDGGSDKKEKDNGDSDQTGVSNQPTNVAGGFGLVMKCLHANSDNVAGNSIGCTVYDNAGHPYVGLLNDLKILIYFEDGTSQAGKVLAINSSGQYNFFVADPGNSPVFAVEAHFAINGVSNSATGFLSDTQTKTIKDLNLYIAPQGNDKASCSLNAPCKTISEVFDRIPHGIEHTVTLSVAAGSYVDSAILTDHSFGVRGVLVVQGRKTDFSDKDTFSVTCSSQFALKIANTLGNITVDNGVFSCPKSSTILITNTAIQIQNSSGITLQNVTVQNSNQGLEIDKATGIASGKFASIGNDYGVNIKNGANFLIQQGAQFTANNNTQYGLLAQTGSLISIKGGTIIANNNNHGIFVQNSSLYAVDFSKIELIGNSQFGLLSGGFSTVAFGRSQIADPLDLAMQFTCQGMAATTSSYISFGALGMVYNLKPAANSTTALNVNFDSHIIINNAGKCQSCQGGVYLASGGDITVIGKATYNEATKPADISLINIFGAPN